MAMQVSWIDAERIKELVAQIAPLETCAEHTPGTVELDTTPEPLLGTDPESWGFAMDWVEPDVRLEPAASEMAEIPAESGRLDAPEETADDSDNDGHDPPLHNPAAALPLSRIRDKLRAIRQRATEAGILTRPSEVVPMEAARTDATAKMEPAITPTPAFDIPPGSREVRLAAFAGWARQVLHEDGGHVLVISDDGEVLWGGEAKAGLVLSTMMAWGAAVRASAASACDGMPAVIHQPLPSGNVLTVIPCETADGMVHAAVAAPAGLPQELAHTIRGALCAAMS